jgi:hypothetical protein
MRLVWVVSVKDLTLYASKQELMLCARLLTSSDDGKASVTVKSALADGWSKHGNAARALVEHICVIAML